MGCLARSTWINQLDKKVARLVVDGGGSIKELVGRLLHIEFEHQRAVEVALNVQALPDDLNVVFLSGRHVAGDIADGVRLRPTEVLLDAMLLVAPATDGPPDIIIDVLELEGNEEAFVAADLLGLEREGEAVGAKRSAQSIGAACAGSSGVGDGSVCDAPVARTGLGHPVCRGCGCAVKDDVASLVGYLDIIKLG